MQLASAPSDEPVLIRTKMQTPRLPAYAIDRPRITAILADAAMYPFVLVLGPPGSGKTVAVQQWLRSTERDASVAWLTLDRFDDGSLRFWNYVVMALEETGVGHFAETRAIITEAHARSTDVVASLVNEAERARPVRLVLDDLHNVRSSDTLDALEMMIEHSPRQLSIVATARAEPPLPLAYWRGSGTVREIRQADLAFTAAEAFEFLARLGCNELSPHDVELLTARTEGWAAAIQLFAVSARHEAGVPDVLADVLSGHNDAIAAFLASEVLQTQPPEIRRFLLETSILDTFDVSTCNAVTERRDARAVLGRLERDNLFLIRVNSRGVFRYHQLFADLIRMELTATDESGSEREALHQRAGQHFAESGDLARAVQHLIAAHDVDAAFELAVTPALAQWDRGETDHRARQTLDLFPSTFVQDDARRIITYIIALAATSDWSAVRRWLEVADGLLPVARDAMEADVAVIWMTLHLINGDSRSMLQASERAMRTQSSSAGSDQPVLPDRLAGNLIRAHLLEDDPWAARSVIEVFQPHDAVARHIVLPAVSARVALRFGELTEALVLAEGAIEAARTLGVPNHPATYDAHLARAGALIDRGELADAEQPLQTLLNAAERRRSPGYQVLALLQQARIVGARDPLKLDVQAVVDLARRSIESLHLSGGVAACIDATEARLLCELGAEEPARVLAGQVPGYTGLLLRARVDLVFGRERHALSLLDTYVDACRRDQLEMLLLRARAQQSRGEDSDTTIDAALRLAAPEQFVQPFLEEGAAIAQLGAQRANDARSSTIRLVGERIRARMIASVTAPLVEPLTARELEVLHYLPRHLSNEEIARNLCVSQNTLKTHLRSIYRKLGADSRFEAVVHARDLHLL